MPKSMLKRKFTFIIFWAILIPMFSSAICQSKHRRSGDFNTSVDEVIVSYEDIIAKNPSYGKKEDLYYELGTLYFQQENERFENAYRVYLESAGSDSSPAPRQTFSRTITHYETFLDSFPVSDYRDDVYYHLAFCYQEMLDWPTATAYYARITDEYPDSPFVAESFFRMGEMAFEEDRLEDALAAYQATLKFKASPLYDEALYKLGWTHYRLDNYADAISIMMTFIDKFSSRQDSQQAAEVVDEVIEYLALSFTDYGPPEKAAAIFRSLAEPRWYERDIYVRMIQILFLRNLYDLGRQAIRVFQERFPLDPDLPAAMDNLIRQAIRENKPADVLEFKRRLVYDFAPGSEWRTANSAVSLLAGVDSLRAIRLVELATNYHQQGSENADPTALLTARDHYRYFIENFPRHQNTEYCLFRLADCNYRLNNLLEAADDYLRVAVDFPQSELAEESGYNAIVCFSQYLETAPDSLVLNRLTAEAEQFAVTYPLSDHLGDVLFAQADAKFNAKRYAEALAVYGRITDYTDFPAERRQQAATLAGKTAFQLERFEDSEEWFRLADKINRGPSTNGEASELTQRAIYEQAKKSLADADTLGAARLYLKADREIPGSELGAVALLQAGELFEKIDEWTSAVETWSRFQTFYAAHAEYPRILWRYGYALEKSGELAAAAAAYRQIPALNPIETRKQRAFQEALRLYQVTENWPAIRQTIHQIREVTHPDSARAEWLFFDGKAAYHQQQTETARKLLTNFIENGGGASFQQAEANFLLGELFFPDYIARHVIEPVDKTLAEKQAAFAEVMAFYAAVLAAKSPPLAVAASYRIGYMFEDFAEKLQASPRPRGLTDVEMAAYEAALQEQVDPYYREARAMYEKILDEAKKENYYDEWCDKIIIRLEALKKKFTENDHDPDG